MPIEAESLMEESKELVPLPIRNTATVTKIFKNKNMQDRLEEILQTLYSSKNYVDRVFDKVIGRQLAETYHFKRTE